MIIYIRKEGDKLYVCDKEMFSEKETIGHPEFMIVAENYLPKSIKKLCENLKENFKEEKTYKMVIKSWPIE